MIVFKRQYVVIVIEVFFTLHNGMSYTKADNHLLSVNREKRSDSTTIFKDQIFKRIEVLECTLTKSTIKSTSTLKTKVECAGLCLSMKNCNSFYWREAYTSCQILAKGDLCMSDMDSVVVYTKIDNLPPSCPSIVGPTHEFTTQFRSALGSLHSRSHTSNFYISMNQSWYHNCNVNYESEEEANIFCQSFHGFNYRPICYERGFYTHSGQLGNQMHSRSDCFVKRIYGQDIDHTNCNNRKCKIWETDLDFQGLYNIVCAAACEEGHTFVDGSCRRSCVGDVDCCIGEKCKAGEGDCDGDDECDDGLVCIENNCLDDSFNFGNSFSPLDDCCQRPE